MTAPRALVTGASGFIGSRLVRHLVENGERVKAFVRDGSSLSPIADLPPDRLEIAYGDILSSHTVYRALSGCDRLYHVAAVYKMWDRRPERILKPAVEGTASVLEAARRRGLRRVVVTSTVGTLGVSRDGEPMDEDHAFNVEDPETYVAAKVEAEKVALARAREGLPVVVVCPAAVFGPGDWKPTPTGRLLLDLLRLPALPAVGGGISVVDVDDVAEGHRLAMERGTIGERYVLAGENLRTAELYELVADLTGRRPRRFEVSPGLARLGGRLLELDARLSGEDPAFTYRYARDYAFGYLWASSDKAMRDLGYRARPARATLERAIRWYLQHGYLSEKASRQLALA